MNFNYCPLTGEPFENRESIEVLYNGTKYTLPYNGFSYGATYDEVSDEYDFSTYPLAIENNGEEVGLIVPVDTPLPITISAGYTETTSAVWEKVGSGGSEPSGDGYEISNPVLTMNISSSTPGLSLFTTEINDDGYLSFLEKSLDDNEVISTIIIGEVYTVDEYWEYSSDVLGTENPTYSNEVNCTASGGLISITDNTKDASIDIQIGSLGKGETYENQKS